MVPFLSHSLPGFSQSLYFFHTTELHGAKSNAMCQFFISRHTYSECKLLETAPIDAPDPGGAALPMQPQASQAARFLRLFVGLRPTVTPAVEVSGPRIAPQPDDDIHVITKKTIVQCEGIRRPKDWAETWDKHVDKRFCVDMVEIPTVEALDDEEDQGLTSAVRGKCPVCEAVQKVVEEKKYREIVVSLHATRLHAPIIKSVCAETSPRTESRHPYARRSANSPINFKPWRSTGSQRSSMLSPPIFNTSRSPLRRGEAMMQVGDIVPVIMGEKM